MLLEIALIVFVGIPVAAFLFSQVVIPGFKNQPLFPSLRSNPSKKLAELKSQKEALAAELEAVAMETELAELEITREEARSKLIHAKQKAFVKSMEVDGEVLGASSQSVEEALDAEVSGRDERRRRERE